jgi:hypothetical protein
MALTDNLLAYWKLDNNGSGGVSLVDSTGNGNTLTNNGGVALGDGKINGGSAYSGTGSYLQTGAGFAPLAGEKTYSGWVRFNNTPTGYQFVFMQGGTSDYQSVNPFYIENNGTVTSIFTTLNGGWTNTLLTEIIPTEDTWHHFATTFNGSVGKLYWNGVEVASSDYTESIPAADNDFFGLGAYPSTTDWALDGNIDEVGIWNRALSAAEVTALYNGGDGISYPFGFLYFNAAVDGNLATLENWWQDSGFTTPADALPDNSDSVFITAPVTSGTATCFSAAITANIGSAVSITANTITLNSGINSGTLVGSVVLNNSASNIGTITGNATFNANTYNGINGSVSGDATFRGTEGNSGTVGGAAEFFDTTENSGTVEGNATFRNSSSNSGGVVEGNATIYNPSANPVAGVVMGTETYLWPNGNGLWGGDVWINGDIAFIIPQPSDVRSGVEYGPASAPYTGTYAVMSNKTISISQLLKLPFPINV